VICLDNLDLKKNYGFCDDWLVLLLLKKEKVKSFCCHFRNHEACYQYNFWHTMELCAEGSDLFG
jgi:hypothetical protein